MNHTQQVLRAALVGAGFAVAAGMARADTVQARLNGFQEVPSVFTVAEGRFKAKIDERSGTVFWELQYEGLQADATMAHIHLGQRHTNGGITVWLCQSAVNPAPPAVAGLTQTCPARAASLNGTITAAHIVATAASQQFPAGGFEQLVRAMRAGATYVNVHTTVSPGGEIRGQIRRGHRDD